MVPCAGVGQWQRLDAHEKPCPICTNVESGRFPRFAPDVEYTKILAFFLLAIIEASENGRSAGYLGKANAVGYARKSACAEHAHATIRHPVGLQSEGTASKGRT